MQSTTTTTTRSDFDLLTDLNHDYVQSVQQGDVRRFEEILAEDFLASNPDGSLVNKQQFLEQTARPLTITGLEAHDVLVRVLGEVAIIHARTGYATEPLQYQADHENERRWLTFDLLAGRVVPGHPFYKWLRNKAASIRRRSSTP